MAAIWSGDNLPRPLKCRCAHKNVAKRCSSPFILSPCQLPIFVNKSLNGFQALLEGTFLLRNPPKAWNAFHGRYLVGRQLATSPKMPLCTPKRGQALLFPLYFISLPFRQLPIFVEKSLNGCNDFSFATHQKPGMLSMTAISSADNLTCFSDCRCLTRNPANRFSSPSILVPIDLGSSLCLMTNALTAAMFGSKVHFFGH